MSKTELTIKDITARAVSAPLKNPITTSAGIIPAAPLVLIDVTTDQGIIGRSYIFGYTPLTLRPLVQLIANLAPLLQGKSVSPFARFREFEATFRLLGRQGLLGMAISGLDMAFWDALGRAADQPVAQLLGGECKPLPAYDSLGVIDPVKDLALLENTLEQGFNAVKIKVGAGDLQLDIDTLAAVRNVIGNDLRLMIDYNQSLTVPEAIRRINRLAEFDLEWVEEPVPAEDLAGHAQVRSNCNVAIQTGENWWFPEDASRAIAAGASDYAMPDLMKIGGITGWNQAVAQAKSASLPVSSHIFVEASAHVLAVTANAHYLEYLDVASAVVSNPPQIIDGELTPTGPGLGMDWDQKAVEEYAQ